MTVLLSLILLAVLLAIPPALNAVANLACVLQQHPEGRDGVIALAKHGATALGAIVVLSKEVLL